MSEPLIVSEQEIRATAEQMGLTIDWSLVTPQLAEGGWDIERTLAQNRRSAELEFDWAITDQSNVGSDGFFPRGMERSERTAWRGVIFRSATDRLERAERKRDHVERLAKVVERLRETSGKEE